ncbi:MAG: gluconokinase, GntK/IdnK-type [Pseudomonadota bacterium]
MSLCKTVSNPEASNNLIIVMGVSGCGKSTLASALAEHYHYMCLDADDFHSDESRTMMAQGTPLTDQQRGPWVASIQHYLQEQAKLGKSAVLAFSGLKSKHRAVLRETGLRTIFLFLNGQKKTIEQRMTERLNHFMPPKLLDSQFESLEHPLDENDVYSIDIEKKLDEVIGQAKEIINQNLLQTQCSPTL